MILKVLLLRILQQAHRVSKSPPGRCVADKPFNAAVNEV